MAATFLDRWMQPHGGMGMGLWDKAIAAGYSGKQIAVASQKEQAAGARLGRIFGERRHAAAMAAKGSPNNWIHNFTGGSGGVGMSGLQAGLASGRSLDEMISATAGLHRQRNDWGVAGFGQGASRWILDKRQREAFLAQQEAMNAQNRDQMTAMMDMYSASPSVREEVGTGANAALKASPSSQKKAKSLSKYDRRSPSFKASVNASSGSKSLNV